MPILTAVSVQSYRPKSARREIADAKSTGLFLIVQPSGQKSWALRFRRPDGRPAKMTLGPVDFGEVETRDEPELGAPLSLGQARQLAASIHRQRTRGIDVIAKAQTDKARQRNAASTAAANTFTACAAEFFIAYRTKRGTRARRWRDDAAVLGLRYPPGPDIDPKTSEPEIIKGRLAEIWATKPVAGIDDHDIHTVVAEARKHGSNGRARKLHSALSVLFAWLKRERRIAANPMRELERPGPPASRERRLDDAEIVTFWKAADRIGGTFGAMFKTLLLTGARLREVSGMTRTELGDDGVWEIPGRRTKNHRPLALPLPKLALDVIASAPVIESNPALIFTVNGKNPVTDFTKRKRQLDASMADVAGRPVQEFRLHDLRRTFASGLAALGVALPVCEKLLNHVSGSFGGIVSVYQRHEYATEKAEALQRWAMHIEGLVSDRPSNVAKLSDAKRKRP